MSEREAVLFANEAFYRAFSDRDGDAMAALWHDTDDVACIHPGWPPLFGREAVMESWNAILGNPDSPQIACRDPQVFVNGETAFVVCYEEIAGQHLIATNIFRRGPRHWHLVHHQAGSTAGTPSAEREEEPRRPN